MTKWRTHEALPKYPKSLQSRGAPFIIWIRLYLMLHHSVVSATLQRPHSGGDV